MLKKGKETGDLLYRGRWPLARLENGEKRKPGWDAGKSQKPNTKKSPGGIIKGGGPSKQPGEHGNVRKVGTKTNLAKWGEMV